MIGRKFKEMVNTNLELSERLMAVRLNQKRSRIAASAGTDQSSFFIQYTRFYLLCSNHTRGYQIAEMILALSNNFKLSLNNGEKYILLRIQYDGLKNI